MVVHSYLDERLLREPYPWECSYTQQIAQLASTLSPEKRWIAQALKSAFEDSIYHGKINVNGVDSVTFNPQTQRAEIRLSVLGNYWEKREGNVCSFTLDKLRRYSLQSVGISHTLETELDKQYPKYALLRQVAKTRPELIYRVASINTVYQQTIHLRIAHPDDPNVVFERISLSDLPLTDAELEILSYYQQIEDLREQVRRISNENNVFGRAHNIEDAKGITGALTRFWRRDEYRKLKELEKEEWKLSGALLDINYFLINYIFKKRAEGQFIESVEPEIKDRIEALEQRAETFEQGVLTISETGGKQNELNTKNTAL